jgi:hypothetical protein
VPVESRNFKVIRLVAASLVADANGHESDYATENVHQMQAGNAEK